MTSALVLTHFNTAAVEDVTPTLLACCDVPRWAEAVIHARPYDDRSVLLEVADAAPMPSGPAVSKPVLRPTELPPTRWPRPTAPTSSASAGSS